MNTQAPGPGTNAAPRKVEAQAAQTAKIMIRHGFAECLKPGLSGFKIKVGQNTMGDLNAKISALRPRRQRHQFPARSNACIRYAGSPADKSTNESAGAAGVNLTTKIKAYRRNFDWLAKTPRLGEGTAHRRTMAVTAKIELKSVAPAVSCPSVNLGPVHPESERTDELHCVFSCSGGKSFAGIIVKKHHLQMIR